MIEDLSLSSRPVWISWLDFHAQMLSIGFYSVSEWRWRCHRHLILFSILFAVLRSAQWVIFSAYAVSSAHTNRIKHSTLERKIFVEMTHWQTANQFYALRFVGTTQQREAGREKRKKQKKIGLSSYHTELLTAPLAYHSQWHFCFLSFFFSFISCSLCRLSSTLRIFHADDVNLNVNGVMCLCMKADGSGAAKCR